MKPFKALSTIVAVSLLLPVALSAAPAMAAQPSSNFNVSTMYGNYFYWFGDNGFNTNVTFGAWSNCPVIQSWLSSSPPSYPTTNPACLVTTASGGNGFQNSGWDSNTVGGQNFILKGNTLEVPGVCFINNSFQVIGCITMVFHGERQTSQGELWVANPGYPANMLALNDSGVYIGAVVLGGTAVFSGPPSASTFVSLNIQEWSYRTPAYYSANSAALTDAIYVPNQQAYLTLTGVWHFTPAPLSSAAMTALVTATPPLPPSPAGQSANES